MRKFISYIFLTVLILWTVLLGLSLVSVYAHYEALWWFGLLGLSFPVLLIGELFLFLVALFFKWPYAIIPLLGIVLSWNNVQHYLAFNIEKVETSGKTLKVMTYNVNVFDLYNWTNNVSTKDSMLAMIKREDPDILCLQEFYTEKNPPFNPYSFLDQQFAHNYFHKGIQLDGGRFWGLATFSKYPIQNSRTVGFTDNRLNLCLVNDIEVDGVPISIYNLHLHSYHIKERDLKGFNRNLEIESNMGAAFHLLRKLKAVYGKRLQQVKAIHEDMNQNKNKILVCGDFNDSPNSYPYHLMKDGLKDAFLERGFGIGGTYRGGTITGNLPSLRIDYILCDTSFQVNSFDVLKYPYSDHYAVTTTLKLKQ